MRLDNATNSSIKRKRTSRSRHWHCVGKWWWLRDGDLELRESYLNGWWDIEISAIADLLRIILLNNLRERIGRRLSDTYGAAFPPPKTGKIAVKVINHYGDEVLKVYKVQQARMSS